MLTAELLESFRPKGLRVKATPITNSNTEKEVGGVPIHGAEFVAFDLQISGKILSGEFKETTNRLMLPIPVQGVIKIGGLYRFVIPMITVDVEQFDFDRPLEFYGINRSHMVMRGMEECFDRTYTDFFMSGQPPTDHALQNEIDTWFKTAWCTREVKPTKIALESIKQMVFVKLPEEEMDITLRHFPQTLLKILDPASTPAGDKVNVIYRMVNGARIDGYNLVPGPSYFCNTVDRFHLPVSLCPRRTHIVRSAYENSVPVDLPEDPLVGAPGLGGRHLITAVTRFRTYTGDDAIVMSQSGAQKLTATRKVVEQFYVLGNFQIKVKEGDEVLPQSLLAETVDPITQVRTEVVATKLRAAGRVSRISAVRANYFNIQAIRIRIECEVNAPALSGDKVITRSAMKGVIRVVDDNLMPTFENGKIIDAIISPESIVGRRAMSFYWEGMVNYHILNLVEQGMSLEDAKKTVTMHHLDPRPKFRELVEAGYGDPVQLYISQKPLPEQTWVAPIYFVRLDKISREIVSWHASEQAKINGVGLKIDSANMNGQKKDVAKLLALQARGLAHLNAHLHEKNVVARVAYEEARKALVSTREEAHAPAATNP